MFFLSFLAFKAPLDFGEVFIFVRGLFTTLLFGIFFFALAALFVLALAVDFLFEVDLIRLFFPIDNPF